MHVRKQSIVQWKRRIQESLWKRVMFFTLGMPLMEKRQTKRGPTFSWTDSAPCYGPWGSMINGMEGHFQNR